MSEEEIDLNCRRDRRDTKKIGPYCMGMELGEGAFAKVRLATHVCTGEKVAVKVLDKIKLQEDPDDIVRIQKEIAILKKLRHKNIVQLYEIMESSKKIYLVMELCENKDLFEYIVMKSRLTEPEALKFYQEIIDAVDYMHMQNIVHRDLKPENMLLDSSFSIKVSDFGLSTPYSNEKLLSTPCGTPSYAPPEMIKGEEYHGLLSDVWSSGIILYAMLCGYLPFSEEDEDANSDKIIQGDYETPDMISELAADLIKHILKVDPLERFDLDQIKSHPWFNANAPTLRPGIIIGYHQVPIDERILDLVESFGYDKQKVRTSLQNNKFDSTTALYYLSLKRLLREGFTSISDLSSEEYLKYITDDSHLINSPTKPPEEGNKINEETTNENPVQSETPKRISESSEKNNEERESLTTDNISNEKKMSIKESENNHGNKNPDEEKETIPKENSIHEDNNENNKSHKKSSVSIKSDADNLGKYNQKLAGRRSVYVHGNLDMTSRRDLINSDSDRGEKKKRFSFFTHLRKARLSTHLNENEKELYLKYHNNPKKTISGYTGENSDFRKGLLEAIKKVESEGGKGMEEENSEDLSDSASDPISDSDDIDTNEHPIVQEVNNEIVPPESPEEIIQARIRKTITDILKRNSKNSNDNVIVEIPENKNENIVTETEIQVKETTAKQTSNGVEDQQRKDSSKSSSKTIKETKKHDNKEISISLKKPQGYQTYISKLTNKTTGVKREEKDNTKKKVIGYTEVFANNNNRKNKFAFEDKKIIADSIIKDNATSVEILRGVGDSTSVRNFSFSPKTAVLRQKNRIDYIPWKFKKLVIEKQQEKAKYEKYKNKIKRQINLKLKRKKSVHKSGVHLKNKPSENIYTVNLHKESNKSFANKTVQILSVNSSLASHITKVPSSKRSDLIQQTPLLQQDRTFTISTTSMGKVAGHKRFQSDNQIRKQIPDKVKPTSSTPIRIQKEVKNITVTRYVNHTNPPKTNGTTHSTERGNNMFTLSEVKNIDALPLYNGPIDFSCLSSIEPEKCIINIIQTLNKKKITYAQTSQSNFHCSKNGLSFNIDIVRVDDSGMMKDLLYVKFKLKQGDNLNFRKVSMNLFADIVANYD